MPSPFPGMDPYLEGDLWTTLHTSLSVEIARQLGPRLRPKYVALPTERLVAEASDDISITRSNIYPDVSVLRSGTVNPKAGGATATAPLRLPTIIPATIPQVTIEIRDTARRELVTAIEILSPTNKRGDGRKEYLVKRLDILLSSAHLLEIDLQRAGLRPPIEGRLPNMPYFVFLSRANERPFMEIWPIALDVPLPEIPIPLLGPDPDATLDLQTAFTSTYDTLGYDLLLDYAQPPDPPLDHESESWSNQRLREAGLRR